MAAHMKDQNIGNHSWHVDSEG